MIDGGSYYTLYLIILTIYTLILSNRYSRYPDSRAGDKSVSSPMPALILTAFMVIFIGCRPLHRAFVDMWNYTASYELFRGHNFQFDLDTTNKVFDNLFYYLASNGYDKTIFFLIMAAINLGGLYIASRKMFPSDTLYALVIYLGAFSTFNYATNGIKAGAAAAIFICAIAYGKNKIVSVLLLLLSIGFHHSMVMPVIAFAICYYYRKPKFYLGLWVFSFLVAMAHITFFQTLFQGFADERGAGYLSLEGGSYYTGFRLDFIIYSFFPIWLGYWAIFSQGYSSKFYNWIYCTYLLVNSIWMLCMYANFTNRIAYLSWLMIPIVLVYPFFDKLFVNDQYKKLNVVAWAHIGFTIMMEVVYYGFIK